MSYGIMAFAVPIATIRNIVGSKSESMEQHLLQVASNCLKRLDQSFDEGKTSSEVLTELIQGTYDRSQNGYKHWYVIKCLCYAYGRPLDNSHWYPCDPDPIWSAEGVGVNSLGQPGGPPSPDDFPVVFTVMNADFEKAVAGVERRLDNKLQLEQFRKWTVDAAAADCDLMLFYH